MEFTCPRCHADVHDELYGPCASCRDVLRATMGGDPSGGDVVAVAYEPKMNVVPNQVATKD